jgi:hypothetical protein
MAGGGLVADEAGRGALERLGRSRARRGADRARAVAWSPDRETGAASAGRLGVGAEQVRRRRSASRSGGVEALRSRPRPGRTPRKRAAALAVAREALAGPAIERPVWTLDPGPARGRDRGTHRRDDLLRPPARGAQEGGYGWRRPRHALKGRRDADAVDRAGPRLRPPRQQAAAGDIHLPVGDESEAPTRPCPAHAWAEPGADLRVGAPGQARRRALPGALDCAAGELIVSTSATARSGDFVGLPERLDRAHAPRPGRTRRPGVPVLDDGPTAPARSAGPRSRPGLGAGPGGRRSTRPG